MSIKLLIFILFYVADVANGKKSFVIVTDTTASMTDELNIMKNHIDSVVKVQQLSGDIENYILVPFGDPDVGIPQISSKPQEILNFLNDLKVEGGNDCPENSLSAIVKALEISKNDSNIFLFTDAPPKDINKLPLIQTLCQQHQSQVIIFLSGECPGAPENNMNIYNEIARSCSGVAFHFDIQNLQQAFKFMKQIVNVDWSNINTHKEFIGRKQFNFNVDAYTKDLIISVAGNYPEVQVTSTDEESVVVETIMATNRAHVVRLLEPLVGEYAVEICSTGKSRVTFYKWNTLEFFYGFSPKKPKSLNETTNAPLPDATSYLFIEQLDSAVELFLLDLQIIDEKRTLELESLNEDKKNYVAQTFFKIDQPFRITIHGTDKNTHEVIQGTTKLIFPQSKVTPRPAAATVEAIRSESTLVEFMSNVTLFCKVTGEPKPDIWWEDDNENRLNSEDVLFEWPSTYISYATIDNTTTNTTVYCKAKNFEGESSLSTELFVHRDFIFEIIQSPSDMTIEYGTEGKLFCEVTSYPEATIQWYHNGSTATNNEHMEIVPEDNMLLIKSMSMDDTGEYVCEVANTMNLETLVAVVGISGLEAPSIEIASSEHILKPGDSMEVECQVKGSPNPEVTWKKEINDELVDIPDGIFVEQNILKISSAKAEHAGTYECIAANIQGQVSKELIIKVQYKPIIKNTDEIIKVNVGELVELKCDVDAEPKATVSWGFYQNDVIVGFGDRQGFVDRHTYRFFASPLDSGDYCCIAENEVGRSEKNITVIVLDPPFIEPLDFVSLRARVGSTLQVTCNVSLGTPVPVTRWEFISVKSNNSVLLRKTTKKLDLVLRNISKANEGYYQCVAENEVAPDSIKFYLSVVQ